MSSETRYVFILILIFASAISLIPAFALDYKTISGVGKDVGDGTITYDIQYSSVKNIISSSVDTKDKSVDFVLAGTVDTNSILILKLPTGLISGPFIGVFEDGQIITNYTTTAESGDTMVSIPISPFTVNISIVGTSVYSQSTPVSTPITVSTDKNTYVSDDSIVISGKASPISGVPISIQVLDPSNNPVKMDQTNVNPDGTYSITVSAGGPMWTVNGAYTVLVTHEKGNAAQTTFTYNTESYTVPSKIPAWVKNVFIWYGQGKISEDDLLGAIKFLVDNGIIQLRSR